VLPDCARRFLRILVRNAEWHFCDSCIDEASKCESTCWGQLLRLPPCSPFHLSYYQDCATVERGEAPAAVSTPDLTGIWSPPRTPKGFLPYSFAPEAPPPMQPWAAKRCDAIGCGKGTLGRAVDDSMDPYITSCAPFGIPRLMNHVGPFEILQSPGRVLMLFETGNSLRQIWTVVADIPSISISPGWGTRLATGTETLWSWTPSA